MCDLTTKWILESAQSLTCALIYWYYVLLEAVTELWGAENSFLRNEREIRRSEGSGMLIITL